MKRTLFALLLTLTLAAATVPAQTFVKNTNRARKPAAERGAKSAAAADEVEQVLDKLFNATGGPATFVVRTRIMRGYVEISNTGLTFGFESYEKLPKKSLIVINAPGGQFLQASDAGKQWIKSPWAGVTAAPRAGGDDFLSRPDTSGGFKWRSLFSAVRVKGRALVEGRPAVVLAATPIGGEPSLMYFDDVSGLMVKLEYVRATGSKGEVFKALYVDSYATVDGVKVPAIFRHVYEDMTMTFRVYEIKHGVQIDDALFRNPNGK